MLCSLHRTHAILLQNTITDRKGIFLVQTAADKKKKKMQLASRVKQITSPGWMHETSARAWCPGKTQRVRVEREVGVGIGMGNTCKSMADSCQCITKPTTIL